MQANPAHAAIVLAAGASRRLGMPKQLLRLDGETLAHRAARMAVATQSIETLIVVGAQAPAIAREVDDLPLRVVHCADWESGLGASLRTGLDALGPACAGALILLCDQPALDVSHLCALRDAWRAAPRQAVASAYAGKRGVPAVLPRAWFSAARALRGDQGAGALLAARHADVIGIANEALARDVDHAVDLDQLR